MARTFEIKRLLSTAGTGYFYIIKRGTKGDKKEKLEVKTKIAKEKQEAKDEEYDDEERERKQKKYEEGKKQKTHKQ